MVIGDPALLAALEELADVAMTDRQRVDVGRRGNELLEPSPDAPVEGEEVAEDAEAEALPAADAPS